MRPKFCFNHKDRYHVNIPKNIHYVQFTIYHILLKLNVQNVK